MADLDFDQQIADLEAQIAKIQEQKEKFLAQSPVAQLAEAIHDMDCHWNHTDGCGWYYEFKNGEPDWKGHAHKRYLERAGKIMQAYPNANVPDLIKMFKIVKGY